MLMYAKLVAAQRGIDAKIASFACRRLVVT
jgi:hypothetical protein